MWPGRGRTGAVLEAGRRGVSRPPTVRGRGSGGLCRRGPAGKLCRCPEKGHSPGLSGNRTAKGGRREARREATPSCACGGSGQRQLGGAGSLGARWGLSRGARPCPQDTPATYASISVLSCGTDSLSPPCQGADGGPESPRWSGVMDCLAVSPLSGRRTFRKQMMQAAPGQTRVAGRGRAGR